MNRRFAVLIFVGTLSLAADVAHAQWMTNFWDGVCRDYHRNKAWPEPFLKPDRDATVAPFAIMVANGWRRQNLLSDYHFNEDQPQLNQAGELKLHYILTQMAPQRRVIFVQRGPNPEVTATRMAVVERTASRMLPRGATAEVVESDLSNDGWPADEIDSVSRKFYASQPDPRLRGASSGGGGGGGGGSAGSGNN